MNPGLSQKIALCLHEDDTLHFSWCWSGATRQAPPEYEYLCAAGETEQDARKISRVLAVHPAAITGERR